MKRLSIFLASAAAGALLSPNVDAAMTDTASATHATSGKTPRDHLTVKQHPIAPSLYEIVYSSRNNALYVASAGGAKDNGGKIIVLDPATLRITDEMDLPGRAFGLALDDQAGRLYSIDASNSSLSIIDIKKKKVLSRIQLATKTGTRDGRDEYSHYFRELVLDPSSHRLFALGLDFKDSALYIIDTREMKVIKTLPGFGFVATGIAFDAAHHRLYLSNQQGELFILDSDTYKVIKKVETSGDQLLNLALDSTHQRLYATDQGNATMRDEFQKTHLPHYTPRSQGNQVLVLDANDGSQIAALATGKGPIAPAIDSQHQRLYVTNRESGSVSIFDTKTLRPLSTLSLGNHPNSLVVDDRLQSVYVVIKQERGQVESVARLEKLSD